MDDEGMGLLKQQGLHSRGVLGQAPDNWHSKEVGLNLTSSLADISTVIGGGEAGLVRLLGTSGTQCVPRMTAEAVQVRQAMLQMELNRAEPQLRLPHRLPPPPEPGHAPQQGWKVGDGAEVWLGGLKGWASGVVTHIKGARSRECAILRFDLMLVPEGGPVRDVDADSIRPRALEPKQGHAPRLLPYYEREERDDKDLIPPKPPPVPRPDPEKLTPAPPKTRPRRDGAAERLRRQELHLKEITTRNLQAERSRQRHEEAECRRLNSGPRDQRHARAECLGRVLVVVNYFTRLVVAREREQAGTKLGRLLMPMWNFYKFRRKLHGQERVRPSDIPPLTGQVLTKALPDVFQGWPPQVLKSLVCNCTVVTSRRDGTLVLDGDQRAAAAYLVAQGKVEIRSRCKTVCRLFGPGRIAHEHSMLNSEPAEHNLVCVTDTAVLWKITRRDLWRELRKCPQAVWDRVVAMQVERRQRLMMRNCVMAPEHLQRHPLFGHWPIKNLTALCSSAEAQVMPGGEWLFE
eukprot:Hpha_TRINITY_DN7192_c0_g2::TRINITY_DN7192_c0_g2_i1::g.29700::m.29700